jgi:copper homeostasis protein
MTKLEICAYSLESCIAAQEAGADRIELCSGIGEGGTTPSAGLIMMARKAVKIELAVMIRPRGGDFCYSDLEFELMQQEIYWAKELGTDSLVLGILKPDASIDISRNQALLAAASPLPVTFHRAFDMAKNPMTALEDLIQLGMKRILTSGQQSRAIQGKDLLRDMVQKANNRIELIAGGGVNEYSALELLQTGVNALHFSAKSSRQSLMEYQQNGISMSNINASEYEIQYADKTKIQEIIKIIQNYNNES